MISTHILQIVTCLRLSQWFVANIAPAVLYLYPVNFGSFSDISEDFIPEYLASMYLQNVDNAVKFHSVQISKSRINIFHKLCYYQASCCLLPCSWHKIKPRFNRQSEWIHSKGVYYFFKIESSSGHNLKHNSLQNRSIRKIFIVNSVFV
jgi:hypothetical protein